MSGNNPSRHIIGSQSIGPIIVIHEKQFREIVEKNPELLVITTFGGFPSGKHRYMISYKGFYFFTKSSSQLRLPESTEIMQVEEIAIPKVNSWLSMWFCNPWDY